MIDVTYERFETGEAERVRAILVSEGLPADDVTPHLAHFITARRSGDVVGCVGLEPAGEDGLLRSLAVSAHLRGRGVGNALCDELERHAREIGITRLFLLTTTAEEFFRRRGFSRIERDEAPPAIQSTREFSTTCPASAVLMRKVIDSDSSR